MDGNRHGIFITGMQRTGTCVKRELSDGHKWTEPYRSCFINSLIQIYAHKQFGLDFLFTSYLASCVYLPFSIKKNHIHTHEFLILGNYSSHFNHFIFLYASLIKLCLPVYVTKSQITPHRAPTKLNLWGHKAGCGEGESGRPAWGSLGREQKSRQEFGRQRKLENVKKVVLGRENLVDKSSRQAKDGCFPGLRKTGMMGHGQWRGTGVDSGKRWREDEELFMGKRVKRMGGGMKRGWY